MKHKTKFWLWFTIQALSILGMGFYGTTTLSKLLVSLVFAAVYIITIIPVFYYAIKWSKETK